jgi:hypothetical protein
MIANVFGLLWVSCEVQLLIKTKLYMNWQLNIQCQKTVTATTSWLFCYTLLLLLPVFWDYVSCVSMAEILHNAGYWAWIPNSNLFHQIVSWKQDTGWIFLPWALTKAENQTKIDSFADCLNLIKWWNNYIKIKFNCALPIWNMLQVAQNLENFFFFSIIAKITI